MSAYFIVDQIEVTDPETMKTYSAGVMDTVHKYGASPPCAVATLKSAKATGSQSGSSSWSFPTWRRSRAGMTARNMPS